MYYWLAGVYTLTQSILSTERLIGLASVYSIISHVINLICCSFRNLWRRTEDLKRCIDTTQGGPCLLVCKVLFTESVTVSDQLNLMKSKVAFTLANWDWIWTETGQVSDLVPVAFTLDWFSYGLWVKCDVSNQHFGKKRHNSKQLSHHSNQPISRLLNPLRLGGFESSPNSVQIRSASCVHTGGLAIQIKSKSNPESACMNAVTLSIVIVYASDRQIHCQWIYRECVTAARCTGSVVL